MMNLSGPKFSAAALVFAAAFVPCEAHAQMPMQRAAADCGGSDASGGKASGEVARVIDGRSFRFPDGREIRLAAIETLLPVSGDEDEARVAAALAARTALETLVLHREVVLRIPGASPDRYGRMVAYAFIRTPSGDVLVQRELLAIGQALVSPAAMAAGCRTYLRDAERTARTGRLGLWGDPYYVVKPSGSAVDVLAEQGRFVVVEGQVVSVRESGGMVYLNFGRRGSQDFTVTILKRTERAFASAGLVPKALTGRHIEVRGWIEERGGPAIEAVRPEQIEIVN